MTSHKKYYQNLYESFGYPPSRQSVLRPAVLDAVAKRLGTKIPAALRDYYCVAGRERRFNICHDRLLAPKEWRIDQRRLVFMEENQSAVWWGISTRSRSSDPTVWQGVNQEPIQWNREHPRCSEFLAIMLHYQAVMGGLRFRGSATVPNISHLRLDHSWTYYGESNEMRAYSRPNQVVCLMIWWPPFLGKASLMVHAGGKTRADVHAIAVDLGVRFD